MLALSGDSRFYVCLNSVDLRKGFEALSAVVENIFPNKLLTGGYFIFFNKSRDKMKVLYWDVDGLAIWYKRLEKRTFSNRLNQNCMSRKEFIMLLEGITPQKIQKRFSLKSC